MHCCRRWRTLTVSSRVGFRCSRSLGLKNPGGCKRQSPGEWDSGPLDARLTVSHRGDYVRHADGIITFRSHYIKELSSAGTWRMWRMTRNRWPTAWRHRRTRTSGKSRRVGIITLFLFLALCINGPICLVQVKGARNARRAEKCKRLPSWPTRKLSRKMTLGTKCDVPGCGYRVERARNYMQRMHITSAQTHAEQCWIKKKYFDFTDLHF